MCFPSKLVITRQSSFLAASAYPFFFTIWFALCSVGAYTFAVTSLHWRRVLKIRLLGIGAVKLEFDTFTIYVDVCNDYTDPPELKEGDMLLFTHDDRDHFAAELVGECALETTRIIGPPTIIHPLWAEGKIRHDQLTVLYPKEYHLPELYSVDGLTIKAFNTDHFLGWHNVHISFLVEYENKRVYISGDSVYRKENLDQIRGVDLYIHSLLKEDIVKGRMNKEYAKHYHICEIIDLVREITPQKLMINHLVRCDWAIDPSVLKAYLRENGIDNAIVPVSDTEIFDL